ncbi:MAG: hypothetical protein QXI12_12325, partial [Candidatus Methanomethyliaceae archaeon]
VLHRGDEVRELPPWRSWEPDTVVETPVGRAEWKCGWHATEAVWEWRAIPSRILGEVLGRVADQHHYPRLAHELVSGCGLRWYVDPQTGVRPKLPDRNELQGDRALEGACTVLVDALVEWALGVARELTRDWPAQVDKYFTSLPAESRPTWQRTWLDEALVLLGWHVVKYDRLDDISVYDTWDGRSMERDQVVVYARKANVVGSWELALTLNHLGYPTVFVERHTIPQVSIEGLRTGESLVALADRIIVDGIGEIPYLVTDAPPFGLPEAKGFDGAVIFAGTPQDFLDALENDPVLAGAIFLHGDGGDWVTNEGDEISIDYQELWRDVAFEVMQEYAGPDGASVIARLNARERLVEGVSELRWTVQELVDWAVQAGCWEDEMRGILASIERILNEDQDQRA